MSDTKTNIPPALSINLRGRYLIEASAGTGKTWTLTGIVLRLLIEAGRPSEHIVATTFTRTASAEMRERIRGRLLDFYQVAQWVNTLRSQPQNLRYLYPQRHTHDESPHKSEHESQYRLDFTEQSQPITDAQVQIQKDWLLQRAEQAGMLTLVSDPINLHLILYLLADEGQNPLQVAIKRTATALTTLDKMFVGTLDSLAQKWLIEYSSETGFQKGVQISEEESAIIDAIIHDELRAFQSEQYQQQPIIYEMLQAGNRLTQIADHRDAVTRALNFLQAPIDEIEVIPVDMASYRQVLQAFVANDISDIKPYFNSSYSKEHGLYQNSVLAKNLQYIPQLQQLIKEYGVQFTDYIDEPLSKLLTEGILNAFKTKEEGGKGFNSKNQEKNRQAFIALPTIQQLYKIATLSNALKDYLQQLLYQLNRQIAIKVRQKLPAILEGRQETTFYLQMARLNDALAGEQGRQLAQYIRHHYPVALVDESQDINGEQASMIRTIYLDNVKDTKGFLLLVGDPKQAIYGFRGGDVANYNVLKQQFQDKQILSLSQNRRSNALLIQALNHWFGCGAEEGEEGVASASPQAQNLSLLGDDIYYRHIDAHRTQSLLSWHQESSYQEAEQISSANKALKKALLPAHAVNLLQITKPKKSSAKDTDTSSTDAPSIHEDAYDPYKVLALHIHYLLHSGETLAGRAIDASDIAILAVTKQQLKTAEAELNRLNIASNKTAEVSIFNTQMAVDLVAVLEAMMMPYRTAVLNRALMSRFFALSMPQIQSMVSGESNSAQGYSIYQQSFRQWGQVWQRFGILSALQQLLSQSKLTQQLLAEPLLREQGFEVAHLHHGSIWEFLASQTNGERLLVDLRQLLDILAQYGTHLREYQLIDWLKQQLTEQPTLEWAVQQPLGSQSGVRLMTIHKSKGLEFPIVYVLGMDADKKTLRTGKFPFYLYDNGATNPSLWQRRLSPVPYQHHSDGNDRRDEKYFENIERNNNLDEFKRLGYVAFTRASEQLYVVAGDDVETKSHKDRPIADVLSDKYRFTPLKHWLYSHESYQIPEYLQPYVSAITGEMVWQYQIKSHKQKNDASLAQVNDDYASIQMFDYEPVYQMMKRHYFQGWAKTSFTALARNLSEKRQHLAVNDSGFADKDGLDDMLLNAEHMVSADNKESSLQGTELGDLPIRFRFVKGANAGSFLHQIFEFIDFQASFYTDKDGQLMPPTQWSQVIDKAVLEYHLPREYGSQYEPLDSHNSYKKQQDTGDSSHYQLCQWVAEVLNTPLLSSAQSLCHIPASQRLAEMGFNMSLKQGFRPEDIHEVFQTYLPNEPEKHIHFALEKDNAVQSYMYRFLRGEIDLVYEYQGKFYIVDYKSNHLGNSLSNYDDNSLSEAMQHAGYWLQASIYQLALHRYLKMRIADYEGNEADYLGGVEYLFLRGAKVAEEGASSFGRIAWQMPIDLIYALDEMFGYASHTAH
ncbi:UvrD-helicase domain-containing protein [Psychrobacter sp. I-STPA6b]|uniref:UvrD-helicase domain-containing protein n=1 Tax=Psychrobacter sp. I-STPA6b TaxID=2585718 RepID=UPI001D0CABE4|nr:UvrD-helicase domain-containing protein [Psychrobacter sp. I-STPA6b]